MAAKNWQAGDRKEILTLVRAVPRAIEKKDVARILGIYDSHSPRFCTFEDTPENMGRINGAEFRKFIGGLSNLTSASIDRKDLRMDLLSKDVALVTGVDDWTSTQDAKTMGGRSRFTIVLWKRKHWRVIHEHFTKIE